MLAKLEAMENVKILRRTKFDDFIVQNGRVVGAKLRQNYRKLQDPHIAMTPIAQTTQGLPLACC